MGPVAGYDAGLATIRLSPEPLHAQHRGRDNDSRQEYACGYGGKGGPESEAHQKGDGAAGPSTGHGQRYGHEYGQSGQAEALMLLYVLSSGAGKKPGEKSIPNDKSPQPVRDRPQKEEQGYHGQQVSQHR